jgi:type III pantothenate kinase
VHGRSAAHREGGVLLVDIGNTRIKWSVWRGGRGGTQHAAAHAGWTSADFARRVLAGAGGISRVLVASVASARVNRRFTLAAGDRVACTPRFLRATRSAAGVVNAYREPWRLGVDRWAAIVAGHDYFHPARAVCVVDIGTAITLDLVDERGRHRGGLIVPGPQLMVESLLGGTSGIRRRAGAGAAKSRRGRFARTTRDALECGARQAAAAVIDRFVLEAGMALLRRPALLLTGGAVKQVVPALQTRHHVVPDLVLRGLALLG